MTTSASSAAATSAQRPGSARHIARDIALRRSGRSRRMHATGGSKTREMSLIQPRSVLARSDAKCADRANAADCPLPAPSSFAEIWKDAAGALTLGSETEERKQR